MRNGDFYTKLMLTVIAAALSALAIKGWDGTIEAQAQSRMAVDGMNELNRSVQDIARKLDDIRYQGLKIKSDGPVEITQRSTDSPIRVRQVDR
jgi:hypothetical protein